MTTRRAFVRGCVTASAAGFAAAAAGGLAQPLALLSKAPFRRVDYLGATVLVGPAPQGLPLLPLAVGPRGELMGNASPPGIAGGVLDWYRYCSHARTPGLLRGFRPRDELLRYDIPADRVASVEELRARTARPDVGWSLDRLGQVARLEDFVRAGDGASVRWRSEEGGDAITAIVLRVDPGQLTFRNAPERVVREGFLAPSADGTALMAYVSFCKHFCCVPGWRESPLALAQQRFGAITCTCHGSAYDPLQVRGDFFMLQDDAGPGGAA
jgi:Rieske Fe-S protein